MGWDGSASIETRYGLYIEASNPGGVETFRTCPFRPWGPASILYNRYRVSFPGLKHPWRGVDHPHPSKVEVKDRVELFLCSPCRHSWPITGWVLSFLYFTVVRYFNTILRLLQNCLCPYSSYKLVMSKPLCGTVYSLTVVIENPPPNYHKYINLQFNLISIRCKQYILVSVTGNLYILYLYGRNYFIGIRITNI